MGFPRWKASLKRPADDLSVQETLTRSRRVWYTIR